MSQPLARRPLRTRDASWARTVAAQLAAAGVRPNTVSLMSLVSSAIGAMILVTAGHIASPMLTTVLFLAVAVCIQLRLLCNLFDGMIAVEGGFRTKSGELFNDAPDRLSDALFLIAAGYAAAPLCPHIATLGWAAALASAWTAYVRYLGATMGPGQSFLGPMAKPHRMALLTAGCVIAAVECWLWPRGWTLAVVLVVIVLGAALTIARRLMAIYREVENADENSADKEAA